MMQHPSGAYGPSVAAFVQQAEESLNVLTSKSRACSSARGSPRRWNYLARRSEDGDEETPRQDSDRRQDGLRQQHQDFVSARAGRIASPEARRLVNAWLKPTLTGNEPLEQALRTLSEGETEVREHLGVFAKTMLEVDKRLRALERQSLSKGAEDGSSASQRGPPVEDSSSRLGQRVSALEERVQSDSNYLKAIESRVTKEMEDVRCRLTGSLRDEAAQPAQFRTASDPVFPSFDTRQEFEVLKRDLEAKISATLSNMQAEVKEQLSSDRRAFEEFFQEKAKQLRELRESWSPVGNSGSHSFLPPTVPLVPESRAEEGVNKPTNCHSRQNSGVSCSNSDQCTIKSFGQQMNAAEKKAPARPGGSSSSSPIASRRVSELAPLPLDEAISERQVKDVSMSAANSRAEQVPGISNISDWVSNEGQDGEEVPNTPVGSESVRTTSTMVRRAAAYIGMQDPVALKTSPKSRLASPSATIAGARSFSDLENITANAELFGMSSRSSRLGSPAAASSAPPATSPFLQSATRSDRLGSWVGRPDSSSSKGPSPRTAAAAAVAEDVAAAPAGVGGGDDVEANSGQPQNSSMAAEEEAGNEGNLAASSSSAKPAESLILPLLSWAEAASAEIPGGLPSRARLARAGGLGRQQADPSLWSDIFAELRHSLLNAAREGLLESLGASLDFDYRLSVFLFLYKTSSTRMRQNVSQDLIERLTDCDSWSAGGAPQEAAEIAASQPPVASPQERDGSYSATLGSSSRIFFSPIGEQEKEDDHSTSNFYSPIEAKGTSMLVLHGLSADLSRDRTFGMEPSGSSHASEPLEPAAATAIATATATAGGGGAEEVAKGSFQSPVEQEEIAQIDGDAGTSRSSSMRSTGTVAVAHSPIQQTEVHTLVHCVEAGSVPRSLDQEDREHQIASARLGRSGSSSSSSPQVGFSGNLDSDSEAQEVEARVAPPARSQPAVPASEKEEQPEGGIENEEEEEEEEEEQENEEEDEDEDEEEEEEEEEEFKGAAQEEMSDEEDVCQQEEEPHHRPAAGGARDLDLQRDKGRGHSSDRSDSDSIVGAVLAGGTDESDDQESEGGEDIEEVLRRVSTASRPNEGPVTGPSQLAEGLPSAPTATMGMWDDLLSDLAGPADHNTVEIQSFSGSDADTDEDAGEGTGSGAAQRPEGVVGALAAQAEAGTLQQQQQQQQQQEQLQQEQSRTSSEATLQTSSSCVYGQEHAPTAPSQEEPAGQSSGPRRPSASSLEVHDFAASDILTLSESMPASAATSGLPSPSADNFGRSGNAAAAAGAAPPSTSGGSVPSLSSATGLPSSIEHIAKAMGSSDARHAARVDQGTATATARLETLSAAPKDIPRAAELREDAAEEEDEEEGLEEEEEDEEYYYEEGEEEELEGDEEEELSQADDEAGYVVNVVHDTE